jgi:hypothetical protein
VILKKIPERKSRDIFAANIEERYRDNEDLIYQGANDHNAKDILAQC